MSNIENNMSNIERRKYKHTLVWLMIFMATSILSGTFLAIFYIFQGKVMTSSYVSAIVFFLLGGIGTGPGAHRLFSHRSFKATHGLKVFLIFCQQLSGLRSVIFWCRVHRTHHKYTDTEKDPTNINRGLFFSSIGFILTEPTPECENAMNNIYMEDLLNDNEVIFQYKYYSYFYITITLLLPTLIPCIFWSESFLVAFSMNWMRLFAAILQINVGNSLFHWNGLRPYDASQTAADNYLWNILTLGEGYHNFHHTFPSDYRSNELYGSENINSLSTFVIDLFWYAGLAYDLKTVSIETIARRAARTGDGSFIFSKNKSLLDVNGNKEIILN